MSFLIHPGRSPCMMLLCLCASKIYNKFSIFIRSRKKRICICFISFLFHQGRSPSMMLLCLSACKIYNTFSISIRSRKKKLGGCSMSFLVRPSRSPGMMLLCLSASRIYNKSLVQHFDPYAKKKFRQLFYILSGSPRQKSWHDVIIPELFQDI